MKTKRAKLCGDFLALSSDNWTDICSYLTQEEFLALIRVSKQLYETLCCPQVMKQIQWTIKHKFLKGVSIGIESLCTTFEKRHLKFLNIGLDMRESGLSVESVVKICCVLPESVTSLDLRGNSIGVEGGKWIGKALEQNKSLTSLNLSCNSIGVEGGKWIGKALEQNNSLTSLDLSINQIGDDGAKWIAKALGQNKSLTVLDLSNNSIEDDGAKCIFEALEKNTSLTSLYLGHNRIKLGQL